MRHLLFAVAFTLLLLSSVQASADLVTEITGVQEMLEQVERTGGTLVKTAAGQIQSLLDGLMGKVDDGIEVTSGLAAEVQRELALARALINGLQRSVDAAPRCLGGEAQRLLASGRSSLEAALNRVPLTREGEPTILLAEQARATIPDYFPSSSSEVLVTLRGANLWAEPDACSGTLKASVRRSTGGDVASITQSWNSERVQLQLPDGLEPGTYQVTLEAVVPRPYFWFWTTCKEPKDDQRRKVTHAFEVVAPITLDALDVRLTPTCRRYDPVQQVIERSKTHGGGSSTSQTFTHIFENEFQGSQLLHFTGPHVTRNNRCTHTNPAYRVGHEVHLPVRCSGRPWNSSRSSRYNWHIVLHGRRNPREADSAPYVASLESALRSGEGRELYFQAPEADTCRRSDKLAYEEIGALTLAGSGRFSDGTEIALGPARAARPGSSVSASSGAGEVTVTVSTTSEWQAQLQGTVQLADGGCFSQ